MGVQRILEGAFYGGAVVVEQASAGTPPEQFNLPSAPFIAGIDLGGGAWDRAWLELLLRHMIRKGAVYLSFYGFDCEAAHDMADAIRDESAQKRDTIILTTWHSDEDPMSFAEEVYFASPAAAYAMKTKGVHIVILTSNERTPTIDAMRQVFGLQ